MRLFQRSLGFSARINKYDILLMLFVASMAAGNVGGALQPVRLITLLFTPHAIVYFINRKEVLKKYLGVAVFCIIWILYSLISLLWVNNFSHSLEQLVYLLIHCAEIFVLFYFFENSNNKVVSLCYAWILMFLITVPIALYELFTDSHLAYSKLEEDAISYNSGGGVILVRHFAAVTFYNLNTYNVIVCYTLPFIISIIIFPLKHNFLYKLIAYTILGIASLIIMMNSSRGALLVLAIAIIYLLSKTIKKSVLAFIIALLLISLSIWYLYSNGFLDVILSRFLVKGLQDNARMSQIVHIWDVVKNTGFLGVGIGNIQYTLSAEYGSGLTAPHNLYMEFLAEAGLLLFCAFLMIHIKIFYNGKKRNNIYSRCISALGVLLLPFIGIINSIYLVHPSFFMYLASLLITSKNEYTRSIR